MKSVMYAGMLSFVALVVGCSDEVVVREDGVGGGSSAATTSSAVTTSSAATTSSTTVGSATTASAVSVTSSSTSASSSSGDPGSECKDEGSLESCAQCCMTDFAAGIEVIQQALLAECACKDTTAVCNPECADNLCAAQPISPACNNCFSEKVFATMDKCVEAASDACQANKDCTDLITCSENCPTM